MSLEIENAASLNPLAVELAEKILAAKFGPERCNCCSQTLPQADIGEVIEEWVGEFCATDAPVVSHIQGAMVNTIASWLMRKGFA